MSIESARSVIRSIDHERYEVIPIGITRLGSWLLVEPDALLEGALEGAPRVLASAERRGSSPTPVRPAEAAVLALAEITDVAFPLVHGTFGEDGCLQGLLELAGIPYVGSGVGASAVGMDKLLMKTVFTAQGLPCAPFLPIRRVDWERDPRRCLDQIAEVLGFPCFVKPANLGSSVGITRVGSPAELPAALTLAAEFSARVIVERAVSARELECGVLGNHDPEASVVGEVIPRRAFYDYEAKYRDPHTRFAIPAEIAPSTAAQVREMAVRAFQAIGASGMARVDFFLERGTERVLVNEINTIPGFTAMSVYPRLWAASGVSYTDLIDRLISLAIEHHQDQGRNRTEYEWPGSGSTLSDA